MENENDTLELTPLHDLDPKDSFENCMRKLVNAMVESGDDLEVQVVATLGGDKYILSIDATIERVQ